jgi:hypothetical protein
VTLAKRRRYHQFSHLLAHGNVLGIAKELFGRAVELHDAAQVVHRDHRVERGREHRALARLARPDGLLGAHALHEFTDLAPERFG